MRRCYTCEVEWLRDNWLKVHLALTPIGTLIVTWVMLLAVDSERWWESADALELAGQTVPFGGIVYASSILVLEVTARMLWALAQRYTDMEQARKEGREEGREQGREEGREEGQEKVLSALAKRGIELPPDILEELNGTSSK